MTEPKKPSTKPPAPTKATTSATNSTSEIHHNQHRLNQSTLTLMGAQGIDPALDAIGGKLTYTAAQTSTLGERLALLEERVFALETAKVDQIVTGLSARIKTQRQDDAVEALVPAEQETPKIPPVDRSQIMLLSGKPVPENQSHTMLLENKQQVDYVVLNNHERSKGFVRPVRDTYRHNMCGEETKMPPAIAETYARDPEFYGGTFCVNCGAHYPVEAFKWLDGTTVGS